MDEKAVTDPARQPPHQDSYEVGMRRAQHIVQKGNDSLDDGRPLIGIGLGLVGIFAGIGTIVAHPVESLADLLAPAETPSADGPLLEGEDDDIESDD